MQPIGKKLAELRARYAQLELAKFGMTPEQAAEFEELGETLRALEYITRDTPASQ